MKNSDREPLIHGSMMVISHTSDGDVIDRFRVLGAIWEFPEMGIPQINPNHPCIADFPLSNCKPSSYWGTSIYGNPHMSKQPTVVKEKHQRRQLDHQTSSSSASAETFCFRIRSFLSLTSKFRVAQKVSSFVWGSSMEIAIVILRWMEHVWKS